MTTIPFNKLAGRQIRLHTRARHANVLNLRKHLAALTMTLVVVPPRSVSTPHENVQAIHGC